MRKLTLSLLTLAVAVATVAGPAAAAPMRVLHPHQVAGWVRWLGPVDATHVAFGYIRADSTDLRDVTMAVRDDSGGLTTFPPPAGCWSMAAGGGHIAFQCGYPDRSTPDPVWPASVMSATGDERSDVDAHLPGLISRVGTQWIQIDQGTDGNWTTPMRSALLDWRTGEERAADPTDPAVRMDADAASGVSPLCAPLRSVPRSPAMRPFGLSLLPVVVHAPWALVTTDDGIVGDPHSGSVVFRGAHTTLRRCGAAGPVAVPKAFGRDAVLGYGWLGANVRVNGRRRIDLMRLADGRRFTVPGRGALSFTGGRLYIFDRPGKTTTDYHEGSVATVQLPRR